MENKHIQNYKNENTNNKNRKINSGEIHIYKNEYNYKYRIRNFQDSYAEIEVKIKYNELPNSLSAEDEFFKNEELKELQIAEKTLTETQDNRMEKHIIYKIPVSKLALTENTSTTVIFKSIRKALEKIKKFF